MTFNQQGTIPDVAVVGSSAAGLFTAYLLASGGQAVGVYEQAEELNPRARTLIVTHRVRELLGELGESAIVNRIRRFELFADGRVVTVSLDRPDLILERAKLINVLAAHAQGAGAQLHLGRRFLGVEADRGRLAMRLGRNNGNGRGAEEVHVRTVIGADGAASKVAQAGGWPPRATVPLLQTSVMLPLDLPSDTARIWFVPEHTPYFYWLIPESSNRGVLGLIGDNGQPARRHLEQFLEQRRLEPLGYQAAVTPLYSGWEPVHRRLGTGDVYLVGDAAGHVKVTTLGGVVSGFRGALGVSETILHGGESSELKALRRELSLHLLVRKALHCFQRDDYIRVFDFLNGTARRVLGLYSRDEAGSILWRLGLRQPRLLLLVLRSILTSGLFPLTLSGRKAEPAALSDERD
jgi:flavin-dependent dehydrogenase